LIFGAAVHQFIISHNIQQEKLFVACIFENMAVEQDTASVCKMLRQRQKEMFAQKEEHLVRRKSA
jgi:hypothetical protein